MNILIVSLIGVRLRIFRFKKEDSLLYNAYQKGKVDGYNVCIEEIIK